ncbi:hypothetical protein [Terracoccus sp. 273MFTsu3.1]|uniref:hypothetical protein n=1 Tax=Terracoccus sp. 273MFTsu3.1 TaxID=1172188 RepID=UPI00036398DA|nr:hypothetical protein [Terracoccus sp. 273MFTsu3.1]
MGIGDKQRMEDERYLKYSEAIHKDDRVRSAVDRVLALVDAETEPLQEQIEADGMRIASLMGQSQALRDLREGVAALSSRFEREGITCECGHFVGSDHNGLGCYARLSYQPVLVTCPCKLTDDQDESEIVAKAIRALLDETPEPEYDYTFVSTDGYVSGMRYDTVEAAQKALDDLKRPHDWQIARRRKAGPWEVVGA